MLRLQVKDQFLDLNKDAAIEMQLNSPLFLSDTIYSDFSFPIVIPYTDKNVRLLGTIFDEDAKLSTYFDVQVYDDLHFLFICKLVVDKINSYTKNVGQGSVEGYLLGGIGNFFYNLKYQRVGQLLLGGPMAIPTNVMDTWTGNGNFVVLPFINDAVGSNGTAGDAIAGGWANRLDWEDLYDGMSTTDGSSVIGATINTDVRMALGNKTVVSIKVKFIMECICTENGWTLDSSLLNGENFDKLLQLGNTPIRFDSNPVNISAPVQTFLLANTISPEITCIDYIMQRCKRYGWYPSIDPDNRVLKLVPLKTVGKSSVIKNWTSYVQPGQLFDSSVGLKTFAFKNDFPSGDSYPSSPTFKDYIIGNSVSSAEALPTPDGTYDTTLLLCILENAYYQVVYSQNLPITDPATYSRKWEKFCDNMYNVEPKTTTDTFETTVCTMSLHYTIYRADRTGNCFYAGFPRCNMDQNKDWGMRDVFYFGLVNEQKISAALRAKVQYNYQVQDYLTSYGNVKKNLVEVSTNQVPFASPIPVLPNGTVVGNWANVFKTPGSVNYKGIIEYWFKDWIQLNSTSITNTVNINLPLHEIANLQWDAIININNIPFLLNQLILPIPYKGTVKTILQPVILDPSLLVQTNAPYNGPVYLKLVWENIVAAPDEQMWYYGLGYNLDTITNVQKGVAKIYCYADEAGTIPVVPYNLAIIVFKKYVFSDSTTDANAILLNQSLSPFILNINATVTTLTVGINEYTQFLFVAQHADTLGNKNHPCQSEYVIQSSDDYGLIN